MKLGIFTPQARGFRDLDVRKPFDGYAGSREYYERCLPAGLAKQHAKALGHVLGCAAGAMPQPYACNLPFIEALSKALQVTMLQEWQLNAKRDLYLLTITPPEWVISEMQPVLEIKRWRSEAARWLKRLDLTAIAIIEPAPFVNYPWAVADRAIGFHLHAICYKTDPRKFPAALAALRKQLGTSMLLKLPAVSCVAIRNTAGDVAYTSGYISKVAMSAKRVSTESKGKDRLRNVPLPRLRALRLAEITSYLFPQELIVTRGKAAWEWRQKALRMVGEVAAQRFPDRMDCNQLDGLWRATKRAVRNETLSLKKARWLDQQLPILIQR